MLKVASTFLKLPYLLAEIPTCVLAHTRMIQVKFARVAEQGMKTYPHTRTRHASESESATLIIWWCMCEFTHVYSTRTPGRGHSSIIIIVVWPLNPHAMAMFGLLSWQYPYTCFLRNVNPHKATGPDGIPSLMLSKFSNILTSSTTYLVHESLSRATVPQVGLYQKCFLFLQKMLLALLVKFPKNAQNLQRFSEKCLFAFSFQA